jgi:hypothetical protein
VEELPPEKMEEINKLKPKPIDLKTLATQVGERLALPAPTDPIAPEPKLSSDPDKVFDTTAAPVVDIGTIVSKRLNAQRKLQANPQVCTFQFFRVQYIAKPSGDSEMLPVYFVGWAMGGKSANKEQVEM